MAYIHQYLKFVSFKEKNMGGWGEVFSKIFDFIPGRKESLANKISKLERQLDVLQKISNPDASDKLRYNIVAEQLRQARELAKNN